MAVPRTLLAAVVALPLVLAPAGCMLVPEDDDARPPRSEGTDLLKTPRPASSDAGTVDPEPDPTASARPDDGRLDHADAYDLLDAAVGPSNTLIDEWNAALDAEAWAAVRDLSGELAVSLDELQGVIRTAPWPADAADAADRFATALDLEIDWYSVVASSADDAATVATLDRPWSDEAVTAADELWAVLESAPAG